MKNIDFDHLQTPNDEGRGIIALLAVVALCGFALAIIGSVLL